jgi:hypothetical protein
VSPSRTTKTMAQPTGASSIKNNNSSEDGSVVFPARATATAATHIPASAQLTSCQRLLSCAMLVCLPSNLWCTQRMSDNAVLNEVYDPNYEPSRGEVHFFPPPPPFPPAQLVDPRAHVAV